MKGREVASVSDFFREDNVFIATGKEQLTPQLVQVRLLLSLSLNIAVARHLVSLFNF